MAYRGSHLSGGHLGADTAPAGAVAPSTLTQPVTNPAIPRMVIIVLVAIVTYMICKQLNKAKSAKAEE